MRPQLGNLDQKIETLFWLNTGTEMKLNRKMVGPETDFDSCEGAWYKSESNTFWLNTGTEMKLNRKMVGPETDFDTCKGAWYKSDQSEYISR
jgi:hypothetical protein